MPKERQLATNSKENEVTVERFAAFLAKQTPEESEIFFRQLGNSLSWEVGVMFWFLADHYRKHTKQEKVREALREDAVARSRADYEEYLKTLKSDYSYVFRSSL